MSKQKKTRTKRIRFLQVVILDLLNREDKLWSIPEILKELDLHHYRTYTTRLIGSPKPNVNAHERRLAGYTSLVERGAVQPMPGEGRLYCITPKGQDLLKEQFLLYANLVELPPTKYASQPACAKLFARIKGLSGSNELLPEEASQTVSTERDKYSPGGGDHREMVLRQLHERRGQQEFRDALIKRYGEVCLVTGCKLLAILEAAHIKPYRGDGDNHSANGLLLRSDIHTLFDLNLLGIEPNTLRIELHPDAIVEYGEFSGRQLRCLGKNPPSIEALEKRYLQFRERLAQP